MKKFLLSLTLFTALLGISFKASAQTNIYFEDFSDGQAQGITWGGGTGVGTYDNPMNNCTKENGLVTPGIGGNNPAKILLPALTFDAANKFVNLTFSLAVLPSSLKCEPQDFICPTYVRVYLVRSDYVIGNQLPTAAQTYFVTEYQLAIANGSNTITFTDAQTALIPNGASYKVYFDFKNIGSNCNLSGTKYVLDNFSINKDVCAEGGCAPYANNDYFLYGMDGFETNTLKGNVFGGFATWSGDASAINYPTRSLSGGTAVSNGLDGDNNSHPLSQMNFQIVTPLTIATTSCVSGTPNPGSLTFNTNGTFTYIKGDICVQRVYFTYKITDPTGYSSGVARVTIDLQENIPLPVTYKSFTATRSSNSQVVLEWETAMEENNRGFHVQRNVDGAWKNIGFVFSQANGGNSSEVLKYAFKDANNSKGISQYRILQVDIDGKGKYSQIRSVHGVETAARVVLFPNPSHTGSFNLLFEDAASVRDVVVSDVSGRVVKQFKSVSGTTLTVEGLIDGFYTVQVANRTSGTTSVEKVIIKKR